MLRHTEAVKTMEKIQITPELLMTVSLSFNKETIYLDVFFKGEKFTVQKYFPNTVRGRQSLESTKEQFNTEEKLLKYFKLGEEL